MWNTNIQKLLLKVQILQEKYNIINSSYSFNGVSDELLANLKFLSDSPYAIKNMYSRTWLIYIDCLLSRNMQDEALKMLKRYVYLYTEYKNNLIDDSVISDGRN